MKNDVSRLRVFDAAPGALVRVSNHRRDLSDTPTLGCAIDIICVRPYECDGKLELRNIYDSEEFVGICIGLGQLDSLISHDDVSMSDGADVPIAFMTRTAAIVYVFKAFCKSGNTYTESYSSGGIECDEYDRFPSGPFLIVTDHEDNASIERVIT